MINNTVKVSKQKEIKKITLGASSTEQTISVENYNKYDALYIAFRGGGDRRNGVTMYIPRACYNISNQFVVNVANAFGTSYVCKSHGYFMDGQIVINTVQLTGWTNMSVTVYGLN